MKFTKLEISFRNILIVVFTFVLFSSLLVNSFASEPILISKSDDLDQVIFDGEWTFPKEWKHSSLETISFEDGTRIEFRIGHQGNYIYSLIDVVSDTHTEKGSDRAVLCFDTNNDKSKIAQEDDYCFVSILGREVGYTLQGGSFNGFNGNFKKIDNPKDLIIISRISDESDRYSDIPHSVYEFRIPLEFIERSNNYGIYIGVFDSHHAKLYSWPTEIKSETPFKIPSPKLWGDLISPDNSLPEFPLPLIILVSVFSILIFYTRFQKSNFFKI